MSKPAYQFEKMHGLGNDFMLLDADAQPAGLTLPPPAESIQRWSDRRFGVGFDQLIYLYRQHGGLHYRFFNADGRPAEQCGNGQRAIALYLKNKEVTMPVTIHGAGGPVQLNAGEDGHMAITLQQPYRHEKQSLNLSGTTVTAYLVDVGNPHCVILSDDVAAEHLTEQAAQISAYFDSGVNLELLQIISDTHIQIRIHERGSGETLACGSGAAAAAIVMRHYFQGALETKVSMPGGDLQVLLGTDCDKISLIGPAKSVYQGHIYD